MYAPSGVIGGLAEKALCADVFLFHHLGLMSKSIAA